MKSKLFLFAFFVVCLFTPHYIFAQETNNKTVVLTVSGEGLTKDEATKNALRSAIEQAFGTFVSANTEILNDELVKDEIVTITSGNIQRYSEIFYSEENKMKAITLQVEVSIGKLVSYAQNKGMSTELAGATFAMNKKMRQLNAKNETNAIRGHLMTQLSEIASHGLFDYYVKTSEPRNHKTLRGYNLIDVEVKAVFNQNGYRYLDLINKVLSSLSLSDSEVKEYQALEENYTSLYIYNGIEKSVNYNRPESKFVLRHSYNQIIPISFYMNYSLFNFAIEDNLGNSYKIAVRHDKWYNGDGPSPEFRQQMKQLDSYSYIDVSSLRSSLFYKGKERVMYWIYPPYYNESQYSEKKDFWNKHFMVFKSYDDFASFTNNSLTYYPTVSMKFVACYSDEQLMRLTDIKVVPKDDRRSQSVTNNNNKEVKQATNDFSFEENNNIMSPVAPVVDGNKNTNVIKPQFVGGAPKLDEFIKKWMKYPSFAAENGIQGNVVVLLHIDVDGSISKTEIIKSPSDDLSKEAKRLVSLMPKWKPGFIDGHPEKSTYELTIPFRLRR